jgi:hypothetical protein
MRRCSTCAGSGQVKTRDQLVVRFQTAKEGEVLDVTPVPDRWLGTLTGEVLVDKKARRIDGCDGVPDPVVRKAGDLLAKAHAVDEGQVHILLQLLHVERIPLAEVHYKYAGVDRQLWICGREQEVYAPNAPHNRTRIFWTAAGAALAVAVLVGLVVFLLTR